MKTRQKPPIIILCAALAVMALAGCGIKPAHVQSPLGEEKDTFPHDYPAQKDGTQIPSDK